MEPIKILIDIILNIIIFGMVFQFSTIIHELGHAILALLLTKEKVKITLGKLGKNNKNLGKISLGRLDIELKGFNPLIGLVNFEESNITNFKSIIILATGPIVSLVLGIILLFMSRNMGNKLLLETILLKEMFIFAGNYQLFTFISTSIPIIYPNWWIGYANRPSDGYQILNLIKNNRRI